MTTLKHPFDADSLVILASKILKAESERGGALGGLYPAVRTLMKRVVIVVIRVRIV